MHSSTGHYHAGMPQLSFTGLSENWLLKECGHRHWEALAADTGRSVPDFVADDGSRSYAAFTAVRLRAQAFDDLAENEAFSVETQLCRIGPIRHFSRHRIASGSKAIATLSMISTFVRRTETGNNRSVARAVFERLTGDTAQLPQDAREMTEAGKLLRKGKSEGIVECKPVDAGDRTPTVFLPCPNNDFNGADFLYFASFQSFVDRAEWQAYRFEQPPVLASRDVFFHGNLNVGDELRVEFAGRSIDKHRIVHWCEVFRVSDDQKIADVVTEK
ncbi:MAG TPA: Pnap_2097 family protein, partial [Paraburkholderia sp.]|nr:Pnap_2097 family protein [Paraburkholderia sp.]